MHARTVLATLLAALLLATACGPRSEMPPEQRRECRRLRTRAAFRGVGLTVGAAVVATALVVVVVAARGNIGGSSGSRGSNRRARRRERRRHRRQVCYDLSYQARARSVDTGDPEEAPIPAAPAAPGEPPTAEVLTATFAPIEEKVRECLGVGDGFAYIDVAIDGERGAISTFDIEAEEEDFDQEAIECVGAQLARLRFAPFDHQELRARFAVDLGWVPPPPQ